MEEGRYVRDGSAIARRYVRSGWFVLDLLAGVPIQNIVEWSTGGMGAQGEALLRANHLLRIFRVFRVLRLAKLQARCPSARTWLATALRWGAQEGSEAPPALRTHAT